VSGTAELVASLRADQRERWRAGERTLAEDYLSAHPAIAADVECAIELIYSEFLLREELGDTPTLEEYARRFPSLAARFKAQLALRHAIDSTTVDDGPTSSSFWERARQFVGGSGQAALSSREAQGEETWPRIEGHHILGLVGRGGMGVVYKARHRGLNRLVAIKAISSAQCASLEHLERFRTEAEAAARLHHPNIVEIYSVGEQNGDPYISMEFVNGGTLAQRLDGSPIPAITAARLISTLADAVAYAHERGVIHRDLKPANVLLEVSEEWRVARGAWRAGGEEWEERREVVSAFLDHRTEIAQAPPTRHWPLATGHWPLPTPKITDFGLAKIVQEGRSAHTQSGAILGTPSYMSPEQAAGDAAQIGPASDVYALGAILYELLTGRPPFKGETPLHTLHQLMNEEPVSVSRLQSSVPRDLETICHKSLAKEVHKRYPTARALAEDLERFLRNEPVRARRAGPLERSWRWCRRNPLAAGLSGSVFFLVLVLGIGLPVTLLLRAERDRALASESRALRAEQRALDAEQEARIRTHLRQASAYRRSGRVGQRCLGLREVREALTLNPSAALLHELRNEAIACLALPDIEVAQELDWPVGSDSAAFDPLFRLYARADIKGNISVRRLSDDQEIARIPGEGPRVIVQFSPNGKYLAVQPRAPDGSWFKVWKLEGADPVATVSLTDTWGYDFSPDNRRVAIGHGSQPVVRLCDLESGQLVGPLEGRSRPALAYHPTEPILAICSGSSLAVRNTESGEVLAEFEQPNTHIYNPTWHSSGRLLAVSGDDKRIYLYDVATRKLYRALEGHENFGIILLFSHAGDLLVSNDWHGVLRLWDLASGRQIWNTPFVLPSHNTLRFSPDDRLLAADVQNVKLRLLRLSSGNEVRTLVRDRPGKGGYGIAEMHPSGRLLAAAVHDGLDNIGIVLLDLCNWATVADVPIGQMHPLMFDNSGALVTHGELGVLRWPIRPDESDPSLWHVGPPQRIGPATSHDRMGASKDARVLAIGRFNQGAQLVHVDSPERDIRLFPQDDVRFAAVSPEGDWVATGSHSSQDVFAKVWNARTGAHVKDLPLYSGTLVGFSPDGRWLATTGGGVRLWTVGSWEEGPQVGGDTFAFSADGQLLALGQGYGVVRLVDAKTGDEHARLELPVQARLVPQCFTPDRSYLVCHALESHALYVWDLRTIRQQLTDMGLNWDLPSGITPSSASLAVRDGIGPSIKIQMHLGDLEQNAEAKARRDIERYRRALAQDPNDALRYNNLAWVYVTAPAPLRDVDAALPLAEKAVQIEPRNPLYKNTLGVVQYRAGRYREAIETLRDAAQHQEDTYLAFDLYFLAMSHHQLGDHDRARDYYDWAVRWARLQPDLPPETADELQVIRKEAESVLDSDQGASDTAAHTNGPSTEAD
jgi:serine/threonine protein kinase/WD40 repeat protein/Tfp pilus assembly protein PilF